MSDTPRDVRWSEDDPELPRELSELLHAGRAELGSAGEVSELARRLSTMLGPAAGLVGDGSPGDGSPGRDTSAGDTSGGDVSGGDASAGGASGGMSRAGSSSATTAPGGPRASALASRRGVPGTSTALGTSRGVWALGGIGAAIAVAVTALVLTRGPSGTDVPAHPSTSGDPVQATPGAAAPSESEAGSPPTPPSVARSAAAPSGSDTASAARLPRPSAPSDTVRAPQLTPSAPGTHRKHPPATDRAAAGARAPATTPAPRDGLAEIALLEQAQAALGSRPADALEYTRRHQERFPNGALSEEREVIAIEALRRLGRNEAARARAAQFERRYRGSVHRPRLERSTDTSVPAGGALNTAPP